MPIRRGLTGMSQDPRQRFWEEVERLVEHRGETPTTLSDALGWERSHLSRFLARETLGGPELAQALDTHWGTAPLLLTLWELANKRDTRKFKEEYQEFVSKEAKASSIQSYAPGVVPGPLQTPGYTRHLLQLGGFTGEELDDQVEARAGRGESLTFGLIQYRAIIDEAALRRRLADADQWAEQLNHLVTAGRLPNVTIQVMPFTSGIPDLVQTDCTFLRLPGASLSAWVETGYAGSFVDSDSAVDRLLARYDRLRDQALSPPASAEFILSLLEEGHDSPE